MKNIAYCLKYFAWILCLLITACSDDDNKADTAVFPEVQKINGEIGQTLDIEFDANMDWKLTSSALWCQFVVEEEAMYSCSGAAGKQHVKVKILDAGTEMGKSYKAEISLWMSGKNAVIYEVTRPTTGYEFVITDKLGNAYTQSDIVTLPYKAETFKIQTNFDWQCIKWPEWVSFNKVSASAGEVKSIDPSIAKGRTIDPAVGEFVFINEANEEVIKLQVKFDGIPEDKIEFSTKPDTYWTFSIDGTRYVASSSVVGEPTWIDGPMSFTATAKNNQYKVIPFDIDENDKYTRPSLQSWYTVTDNNAGSIKVAGTENKTEDSRNGCVMVLPIALYNQIGEANLNQTVIPGGSLHSKYKEYKAIEFTQSGIPVGFKVFDANDNRLLATSLLEEGKTEEELIAKYRVSNVYRLKLATSYETLTVKPNGVDGFCQSSIPSKPSGWEDTTVANSWGSYFYIHNIPATAGEELVIEVQGRNGLHGVLILSMGATSK